jgi:hypothetical protein
MGMFNDYHKRITLYTINFHIISLHIQYAEAIRIQKNLDQFAALVSIKIVTNVTIWFSWLIAMLYHWIRS